MKVPAIVGVFKETAQDWSRDKATRLAAALAYYTVLSLAPMLVLAIAVASLVYGDEARDAISNQLGSVVGPQAAEGLQTMLSEAKDLEGSSPVRAAARQARRYLEER
jgi:membrane protein